MTEAKHKPVAWMMVNPSHLPGSRSLHWVPQNDWHATWEALPLFDQSALDAAVADVRSQYVTALRLAREGYAAEEATGLPVLPQWRERVMALLDAALTAQPELT